MKRMGDNMNYWIISANGNLYNHAAAFSEWGFIDWSQHNAYEIGDIIYIYCTRPYQRIMYKTYVEKVLMKSNQIVDDKRYWKNIKDYEKGLAGRYARLRLIEQVNTENLSLDSLQKHGLQGRIQGPRRIDASLVQYIENHMNNNFFDNLFPDSDLPEGFFEGAVQSVCVNKYERSSIARQKCIEYHGCRCQICGLDFEDKYGALGKGFIHVHHIVPLNEISNEYIVDYKKDLIPVCPNCHAMLHRKINGKTVTVEELKELINEDK